jgi:hypothetical protein
MTIQILITVPNLTTRCRTQGGGSTNVTLVPSNSLMVPLVSNLWSPVSYLSFAVLCANLVHSRP